MPAHRTATPDGTRPRTCGVSVSFYSIKSDGSRSPEIVEVTFAVLVTVASIVSATVAVALPFALTHPGQIR